MVDVREKVSLASCTTLGVGGLAEYFVVVESEEELVEAGSNARPHKQKKKGKGWGGKIIW